MLKPKRTRNRKNYPTRFVDNLLSELTPFAETLLSALPLLYPRGFLKMPRPAKSQELPLYKTFFRPAFVELFCTIGNGNSLTVVAALVDPTNATDAIVPFADTEPEVTVTDAGRTAEPEILQCQGSKLTLAPSPEASGNRGG